MTDRRDLKPIATLGAAAAKVLDERGELAWRRAEEFEAGTPTSRAPEAASGGTRVDEDGIPITGVDPVGDAVADGIDDRSDLAELRRAVRAFEIASQRLADLVDLLTRTKLARPPEDPRGWCPVCRRAGVHEPSSMRDDGSQRYRDRDGRCRPCIRFREANGFDRPAEIIKRRAEGRRLSQADADRIIGRARREHELEQRKAETRAALRARSVRPGRCVSVLVVAAVEHRCDLEAGHDGEHQADDIGRRWGG